MEDKDKDNMSEQERQDVNTMTAEEVRREIARLLGWRKETQIESAMLYSSRFVVETDKIPIAVWIDPDGHKYKDMFDFLVVGPPFPNWPGDDGAAIQLVVAVVDRLNQRDSNHLIPWHFEYCQHYIWLTQITAPAFKVAGEDAFALSKLALLALRELAAGDG